MQLAHEVIDALPIPAADNARQVRQLAKVLSDRWDGMPGKPPARLCASPRCTSPGPLAAGPRQIFNGGSFGLCRAK